MASFPAINLLINVKDRNDCDIFTFGSSELRFMIIPTDVSFPSGCVFFCEIRLIFIPLQNLFFNSCITMMPKMRQALVEFEVRNCLCCSCDIFFPTHDHNFVGFILGVSISN